ncbi:hypothetical protein BDZ94DRAFT_1314617 [Collybia nuda]|uniref:Uncharacterized protein n=1 Tax=Collybia nuda TaxID=64659 RepID=A0A9P6C967_9AGAR|nr:hypothetical protein BDZ94DRAFT_1314617 [Collybia nuda]
MSPTTFISKGLSQSLKDKNSYLLSALTATTIVGITFFTIPQPPATEVPNPTLSPPAPNSFVVFLNGPGKYIFIGLGVLLFICLAYILGIRCLLRKKNKAPLPSVAEYLVDGDSPMLRNVDMGQSSLPSPIPLVSQANVTYEFLNVQSVQTQYQDMSPRSSLRSLRFRERNSVLAETTSISPQISRHLPRRSLQLEMAFYERPSSFYPEDNDSPLRSAQPGGHVSGQIEGRPDRLRVSRHISHHSLQLGTDRSGSRLSRYASSLYPASTLPEYTSRCSGGSCPAYSDLSRNNSAYTYDGSEADRNVETNGSSSAPRTITPYEVSSQETNH